MMSRNLSRMPARAAPQCATASPDSDRTRDMEPITTTKELAAACTRLAKHDFITVDTEFLRETTYFPILCVAQVASADEAIVIDALAEGIDLTAFFKLMANGK